MLSVFERSPCGVALLQFLVDADEVFDHGNGSIDKELHFLVVQSFRIGMKDGGLRLVHTMRITHVVSQQPCFDCKRLVIVLHELGNIQNHIDHIRRNNRVLQRLFKIMD